MAGSRTTRSKTTATDNPSSSNIHNVEITPASILTLIPDENTIQSSLEPTTQPHGNVNNAFALIR
ncbi:hypothetical protein A2U01_0103857, partial [Trifolium medium]|nr:hypothetical protein [Trifolium medium]